MTRIFNPVTEHYETLCVPLRNEEGKEDPLLIDIREYDRETRTPSLVLKVDNVIKSTLTSFKDHAPLVYHWFARAKETTRDSTSGLKASASDKLSDIVVVVLNDPYLSSIETNLQLGREFKEVSIKLLHWSGESKPKIIWEALFGIVRVVYFVPGSIYTAVVFRANEYLHTRYKFEQTDGSLAGQAPVSFNYATNSTSTNLTAQAQP